MDQLVAEIAALKEQNKSAFRRIESLEENVKIIPRIETLLEITIETNKKQSDTLTNINTNLTNLNNNHDNLTHRIGTMEEDFKKNRSYSTININELFKETIFKIVPSILGGVVLTWLIIHFGLK